MSKVFLITGAGRGMGVDVARAAQAAGHSVVATGRRPGAVEAAIGADAHRGLSSSLAHDDASTPASA